MRGLVDWPLSSIAQFAPRLHLLDAVTPVSGIDVENKHEIASSSNRVTDVARFCE